MDILKRTPKIKIFITTTTIVVFFYLVYLLSFPLVASAISRQQRNTYNSGSIHYDIDISTYTGACIGTLPGANNAEKVWNFFISKGFSPEQTAGILGNMAIESGFEPMQLQNTRWGSKTPSSEAESSRLGWGLVQWTPARKVITTLRGEGASYDYIDTVEQQVAFLLDQLEGTAPDHNEKAAGDDLKIQTTVAGATESFMKEYERPRDQSDSAVQKRVVQAENYFNQFSGNTAGGAGGCITAGNWTWPSTQTATVTSCFGLRSSPGGIGSRNHRGVDIAAGMGSPVYAAADGEVTFSGSAGDAGLMVVIKHSEILDTRYLHNSRLLVNIGDQVTAGQRIADEGSTGSSTGSHLHFEIKRNNEQINPFTELAIPDTVTNRANCTSIASS
jgi:murein DD-endopeptidase MepM/ murein hydrolase activator NlpD